MAANDWLFEVGVDTTKADAALKDFVARTKATLESVPPIQIKVQVSRNALANVQSLTDALQKLSAASKDVTLNVNASKAADELGKVTAQLQSIVNGAGVVSRVGGAGFNTMSTSAQRATESIQRSTAAVDWLGKVWNNTMFKFLEFQVIGASIEGTIHGIANGLKLASDVQLEQTLQKLYNPQVFDSTEKQTQALKDASVIAIQWGSDIRDVLQVQGLWTKQTNDLASATYLANQAEAMHRASGIETMDVYRDSIALATQLGVSLGHLPSIYDQVAEASLKIAVPMKAYGSGASGRQEAMKDIFKGLAESAATLKSVGFDTAGAIAAIAEQVQATGETGETAARNLSAMFAALEGSGTHRTNFLKIIGTDAKDTDTVLQRMLEKLPEIKSAYAKGDLGVRPSQYESMNTFLSNLQEIKKLYEDIKKNSDGKLLFISNAEMNTLDGQMARLQSETQLLQKSFGDQLLPTALDFVRFLNTGLLPALTHNAGAIVNLGSAAVKVGEAFLVWQGINKVVNSVQGAIDANRASLAALQEQQAAATVVADQWAGTELGSVEGLSAATEKMTEQQRALDLIAEKMRVAEWETKGLDDRMKALGVDIADVNTVIGSQSVTAFEQASGAIRGFLSTALQVAAPLLAIQGAITLIGSVSDSYNANKVREVGNKDAVENLFGGGKNFGDMFHAHDNVVAVLGRRNVPGAYQEAYGIINEAMQGPTMSAKDIFAGKKRGQWNNSTEMGQAMLLIKDYVNTLQTAKDPTVRADAQTNLTQALTIVENLRHPDAQAQLAQAQSAAQKAQIAKTLAGITVGNGAQEEPPYGKTPEVKGMPDQQDILRHRFEAIKRDQQGLMTQMQQMAQAAKSEMKALNDLAAVRGWDSKSVKQLSEDYKEQIAYTKAQEKAANDEQSALAKKYQEALKQEQSTRGNVKQHEKALTNLSMIEAAYDKTRGHAAALRAEVDALNAAMTKDVGAAWIKAALNDPLGVVGAHVKVNGIPRLDTPIDLAGFRKDATRSGTLIDQAKKNGGLSAEIATGGDQIATLHGDQAFLEAMYKMGQQAGLTKQQLEPLHQVIAAIGDAIYNANGKVKEANDALQQLGNTVQGISDSTFEKLAVDAGDMLDIDNKDLAAVKDYLTQLKSINEERDKLQKIMEQIGQQHTAEADAVRHQVTQAEQLLNIQQQLLPLVEQEKQIRDSIQYKATADVLQKYGTSHFNTNIDKMFGIDKKHAGNDFQQLAADWTKQVADQWWQQMSKKLTDKLFHINDINKEAQAAQVYSLAVQGMTNAAKIQWDASQTNLHAAQIEQSAAATKSSHKLMGPFDEPPKSSNGTPQVAIDYSSQPGGQGQQVLDANGQPLSSTIAAANQGPQTAAATQKTADGVQTLIQQNQQINDKLTGFGSPSSQSGGDGAGFKGAGAGGNVGALIGTMLAIGHGGTGGVIGGLAAIATIGASMFGHTGKDGKFIPSNFGKTLGKVGGYLQGAAGAYGGYEEATTPGAGFSGKLEGAFSSYESISSIPGFGQTPVGQGVAIGAAVFDLLSHQDNPAAMPDKYDTQNYGQIVANLMGSAGANGQSFSESSDISSQTGGKTEIAYIEEQLANGKPSWMSDQQYQQYVATFGKSKTGSGTLNFEHNIGQEYISGAEGVVAGDHSYQQLGDMASKFMQQMQSHANQALAPLISMNAYGAGPNYKANPNNLYGLSAAEQKAMRDTQYKSLPTTAWQGTSPYDTPGVGSSAPGSSASKPIYTMPVATQQPINLTTTLQVSGQVLAQIVNAINADLANRYGNLAA